MGKQWHGHQTKERKKGMISKDKDGRRRRKKGGSKETSVCSPQSFLMAPMWGIHNLVCPPAACQNCRESTDSHKQSVKAESNPKVRKRQLLHINHGNRCRKSFAYPLPATLNSCDIPHKHKNRQIPFKYPHTKELARHYEGFKRCLCVVHIHVSMGPKTSPTSKKYISFTVRCIRKLFLTLITESHTPMCRWMHSLQASCTTQKICCFTNSNLKDFNWCRQSQNCPKYDSHTKSSLKACSVSPALDTNMFCSPLTLIWIMATHSSDFTPICVWSF